MDAVITVPFLIREEKIPCIEMTCRCDKVKCEGGVSILGGCSDPAVGYSEGLPLCLIHLP